MRYFYIFNINKEFITLTKKHPYSLFKTFEEIYNLNKQELNYGISIYNNIINPFNKNEINNKIYNDYYLDDHYIKFKNIHTYNDYYSKENTKLTINNSYMLLITTSIKPIFFNKLNKYNNLFVCDFRNKDYFWLETIA